ncbi:Uncharacterised protein [Mycobacterium tuberculosis]|nr:Uncharacterised protein [Mycobacterium tuberculosis]
MRLAEISAGGTWAAKAASYALAAAVACAAASPAVAPAACIQLKYGVTAANMAIDVGPLHAPLTRVSTTDE